MERNEMFMREAIRLANIAADNGEVPVGAIIVYKDEIIASAYNRRENEKCATHHAELMAIEEACRVSGGWRLFGCELYVTMEPCLMCAGALVQSRIKKVVYGVENIKFGFVGSIDNILENKSMNHTIEITKKVCEKEIANMLKEFFKDKRK